MDGTCSSGGLVQEAAPADGEGAAAIAGLGGGGSQSRGAAAAAEVGEQPDGVTASRVRRQNERSWGKKKRPARFKVRTFRSGWWHQPVGATNRT